MTNSGKKLTAWVGAAMITMTGMAGASATRAPQTTPTTGHVMPQGERIILLADQGGDDKKKDDKKHDRHDDKKDGRRNDRRDDGRDDRGHDLLQDLLPHHFA